MAAPSVMCILRWTSCQLPISIPDSSLIMTMFSVFRYAVKQCQMKISLLIHLTTVIGDARLQVSMSMRGFYSIWWLRMIQSKRNFILTVLMISDVVERNSSSPFLFLQILYLLLLFIWWLDFWTSKNGGFRPFRSNFLHQMMQSSPHTISLFPLKICWFHDPKVLLLS